MRGFKRRDRANTENRGKIKNKFTDVFIFEYSTRSLRSQILRSAAKAITVLLNFLIATASPPRIFIEIILIFSRQNFLFINFYFFLNEFLVKLLKV